MGEYVRVSCRNCMYWSYFNLGIGMQYYLENVLDDSRDGLMRQVISSGKMREKVKKLIAEGADLIDGYGHSIYGCDHCCYLTERFRFELKLADGSHYTPSYRCGRCRRSIKPVNIEKLERVPCPECRKNDLEIDDMVSMLWD